MKTLYGNSVAHRDMKPANILVARENPLLIKIADFGFARKMEKMGVSVGVSQCGSPMYMAPEVNSNQYSTNCDLWSIGIIMLEMLYGNRYVSFTYETLKTLTNGFNRNLLPQYTQISNQCIDLLIRLLQPNTEKRISWSDFFVHPYLHSPHISLSILPELDAVGQIQTFSFPSMATSRISLDLDTPHLTVQQWKTKHDIPGGILVVCKDINANKSIQQWNGVELIDYHLLANYKLDENPKNTCLFIFQEVTLVKNNIMADLQLDTQQPEPDKHDPESMA